MYVCICELFFCCELSPAMSANLYYKQQKTTWKKSTSLVCDRQLKYLQTHTHLFQHLHTVLTEDGQMNRNSRKHISPIKLYEKKTFGIQKDWVLKI